VPALPLLVLRVADLGRSRAFYETLGMAFREERHGGGPEHLAASFEPHGVLELYPRREELASDDTRLGFRLTNRADVLRALGLAPSSGPVVVVVDPDGRRVELSE
jgi:lactoylglutathione lyase